MPAPRRIPPARPNPSSAEPKRETATHKRESDPLGKLLVQAKGATPEQIQSALTHQRKSFKPLGRILREEFGISAELLAAALRRQDIAPRIFLRFFPVSNEAQHLLDIDFCRQHEAVAFERLGNMLCVAFSNPNTKNLIKHIELLTSCEVKPFVAPWEDIQKRLALG